MARKSKFALPEDSQALRAKWRVGDYLRLSKEDGDREESDSISTQKNIAKYYIDAHEDMVLVDEYIDDGWSGVNFERPRFMDMIEDIKTGRINCVVVKDLSRLGRNYIEVGRYIETFFPLMNVRFIAINDNVDSIGNPDSVNSIIVPFKNLINDEYCRDISNKIRSALTIKRKQGKFIGSFASYGYMKDPNDHNHLVIDGEVAPVICDIFNWFLSGMSMIGIAKKLNNEGVLNPSSYKRYKGMNYKHPQHDMNDALWSSASVRRILTNRLYIGDMVQGKNKIKSYKLQVSVSIPKDEWIIIENTHEAIVDRDAFGKVQEIFERDHRTPPTKHHYHLLSGYVRCADCKRAMNRKLISQPYKNYTYYVCSTYKKMDATTCSKHTIRSDRLEKAVFETIKAHIQIAVSLDEALEEIKRKNIKSKKSSRLEKVLDEKERSISSLLNCKMDLYPDWKNGIITQDEYLELKERTNAQICQLENDVKQIKDEIEAYKNVTQEDNAFLTYFLAHKNIKTLTREVVVELVDMIYVHEGGEITIKFKYQNEYLRLLDLIKEQDTELSLPTGAN